MRIAMVSAHASPLAPLGDGGNGGINVHVAELTRALGLRGHEVTVYTRRDDPGLPRKAGIGPNATVVHLDAGPPAPLAKEQLWPYLDELGHALERAVCEEASFDVVHSHYWISGVAAQAAFATAGAGAHVHTPHALGVARKRHPPHDVPALRLAREEELLRAAHHIVATSSDEVFELRRLGLRADRVTVVPSGVDLELFHPKGPVDLRRPGWSRIAVVGRLLPRKGVADVLRALPDVPGAELVIAGGPPRDQLFEDPEAQRLRELAAELGVLERSACSSAWRCAGAPPGARSRRGCARRTSS
jgi:glycosyltransferase involved in cell wall biosynthesis